MTNEQHTKESSSANIDDLLGFHKKENQVDNAPGVQNNTTKMDLVDGNKEKKAFDNLSPEHKNKARELAHTIEIGNDESIISYGSEAQKSIGDFSHSVLKHVKNHDMDEIGGTIAELSVHLKNSNVNDLKEPNWFQKMFFKAKTNVDTAIAKHEDVGGQIDAIAQKLNKEKDELMEDNKMLHHLYDENYIHYEALSVFIAAGELRLDEIAETVLPEMRQKAEVSTDQMDIQKLHDMEQFVNRLEKRIHDLKIARQMTIQQAPQIRMIQNTNQTLSEKIQTSINTSIPLWKNQMVITLSLIRQRSAVEAQKAVSETTNDLLIKNSEMLKMGSVETAKENEREVIDLATLETTQTNLIETLDETLSIQREGRNKRRNAQKQLESMEDRLKKQLLDLKHAERIDD